MKTVITHIQKRFGDVDVFRHVNNVHQQEYLDLGKTDYYRQVLGLEALDENPTLMIVSVKTDFVAQVRYEDEVFVRTRVERIGTKSITLRQQIVRAASGSCAAASGVAGAAPGIQPSPATPETVCTESESVLVTFDRNTQTTLEIPTGWRERIA